jgi:glucan phosphorylase
MNLYDIKQQPTSKSNTTPEDMLAFLDDEKKSNEKENWNKLSKTKKVAVLTDYADRYGCDNKLSVEQIARLKEYLKYSLNVTKLLKLKDIIYNKEDQTIEKIPMLCEKNNNFYINRNKTVSKKPTKNRTIKIDNKNK